MLSTKWTPKLIIWSFTFEECDFNSDYWLNFVENTSIQLKIALILLFTFIGCMSIYCNSIHHSTSSWTTPQDGGQVNVTIGIHLSTLIAECRPNGYFIVSVRWSTSSKFCPHPPHCDISLLIFRNESDYIYTALLRSGPSVRTDVNRLWDNTINKICMKTPNILSQEVFISKE